MDTKEKQEQRKQLLGKIGKYTVAAGAALLTGNLANANVVLTTTTIDIDPQGSWSYGRNGGNGIDFDQDGLDDLVIWAWTATTSTSWTMTSGPGASISIGLPGDSWWGNDPDPHATTWEVVHGGPFGWNGDPAALPLHRIIGPTLEDGSSSWSDSNWDTIFASSSTSVFNGVFGYYLGETRYIGVRFSGDGGSHWKYGWIGVQIADNLPFGDTNKVLGQIINYAYETERDTPIYAGDAVTVPLLPIASALGLGLVGLFGFLRNRRKKSNV